MAGFDDKTEDRWSRERIAKQRIDAQGLIADKRLQFQKDQADRKTRQIENQQTQKNELAHNKIEADLMAQEAITDREVKLEELRQSFYAKKQQIDYEFDAKYRDLDFQQYRLQSQEDIKHQKAIIAAQTEANISEYKAQLAGEMSKMQLAGSIERDRIREELKSTLYQIKANLMAELAKQKQQNEHEMALLKAKHEYDMEMEILKDELRRSAHNVGIEEISDIMNELENSENTN